MKNYEDGVIGCPLEIIILREKHPGHVLFCISKCTFCKLWAASIVVFFSTSQIKSSQISFPKFSNCKVPFFFWTFDQSSLHRFAVGFELDFMQVR